MKCCRICKQPKTYHLRYDNDAFSDHKFELDNLDFLERKFNRKQLEEAHKKRNTCQLCKLNKKAPFGICKECSETLIKMKII